MKFSPVLVLIGLLLSNSGLTQDEVKRKMYYGNLLFTEGNYEDALGYFEDAVSYSPLNFKANYNLANTYYRLNNHKQAIETYEKVANLGPTSLDKSRVYHNMGNSHMMMQDLDKAIESYKSALRLNPSDEETRYNLAYALFLKNEQDKNEDNQENQENGNQDNENQENSDSNEENGDNSENSNQNNSDEQNDNQENQNSEGNDSEEKDPKNGGAQDYGNKLSKEDIQRILDSYYKREKDIQKMMDQNKRVGYGSPKKKDW